MVDNIQSTQSTQALNKTQAEMAAQDQIFPGAHWGKGDLHKFIGQWVNGIIQTLHQENAQMQKASEELKKSEEGN